MPSIVMPSIVPPAIAAPRRGGSPGRSRTAVALRGLALAGMGGLLSGCNLIVMNPSGDIALQQRNLIIASTALMLLVIVPVIVMTFVFAWRYRASNQDATYDPGWHHSTQLEVGIWAIPLLIVVALGAMTWISTHTLDPYRPLGRLAPDKPVPPDAKPLTVQVVALDWKWLFVYPELGIASVNEAAAPVDTPISFKITSSNVWNTFSVPALAGMIYAMPGMETQLQAVANRPGDYQGLSGHYSGTGFSRMVFTFRGQTREDFDRWVAKARESGATLDRAAYLKMEKPSEADPVRYFSAVEGGLYDAILGMCVEPGQMCMHEMHGIDRKGGAGKNSRENVERLDYDRRRVEGGYEPNAATFPASGREPRGPTQPEGAMPREGSAGGGEAKPGPEGTGTQPGASGGPAPPQIEHRPSGQPHRH